MHEERGAAVNVRAQHAETFVHRVPGLHDNVVEFVAQEVFDNGLVAGLNFEKIRENAHGGASALHGTGLEEPADGLGGISMFGDDGFEGSSFAECRGKFRAQAIEMVFALGFLAALEFQQFASAGDFFCERFDALA